MSRSRLAYLFNRYINKECTAEEKTELYRLLDTEDTNGELKQLLDQLIANTGIEVRLSEASGQHILQSIIRDVSRKNVFLQQTKPAHSVRKIWWRMAAAAVLLLFTLAYLFYANERQENNHLNTTKTDAHSSRFLSVSTTTGQWKSMLLADGTRVWLSPSSRLQYPLAFTGVTREISLSGEAFFEVAHDAAHPFIIQSGGIETKVLGTSFNIQAYDNQEEISVTVVSGRVNVTDKAKVENIDLIANERAVFHRTTTKLEKEHTDTNNAPNMQKRKDGMFVYTYERLQKVIDDLREYYGVEIKIAKEIQECKVMANFYINQDIQEILEPIALSINGSLHKKNNGFIIDGKGCPK